MAPFLKSTGPDPLKLSSCPPMVAEPPFDAKWVTMPSISTEPPSLRMAPFTVPVTKRRPPLLTTISPLDMPLSSREPPGYTVAPATIADSITEDLTLSEGFSPFRAVTPEQSPYGLPPKMLHAACVVHICIDNNISRANAMILRIV